MNIVITCALSVEFNEARNQLSLKEVTSKKDSPRIAQRDNITLICTGIGKLNTSINLLGYVIDNKPSLIIDSGTCGSLKKEIGIKDIVICHQSRDYFNTDNPGKLYSSKNDKILTFFPSIDLSNYIVASIEDSIVTDNDREKVLKSGASIVTWETSSVFALCEKLNIACISVRGVTDQCNCNTFDDFKANRVEVCKKLYNSVKTLCMSI